MASDYECSYVNGEWVCRSKFIDPDNPALIITPDDAQNLVNMFRGLPVGYRVNPLETPDSPPNHPEEYLSPAEKKRRALMAGLPLVDLPPEVKDTIQALDPQHVRNIITAVDQARKTPGKTDWDIHLDYLKSIAAMNPDPLRVEDAKVSDLLMTGHKRKKHYLF